MPDPISPGPRSGESPRTGATGPPPVHTSSGPPRGPSAEEYHRVRDHRRRTRGRISGSLLLVTIVVLGLYYGPGALTHPGGSSNASTQAILPVATLGNTTTFNTTCGNGALYPVDSVPWVSSNVPMSTATFHLEEVELIDGDVDGGPEPTPVINATAVCAGAPPSVSPTWYTVLQSPSGSNLAYYTYTAGWVFLSPSVTQMVVANGSTLVLVADPFVGGLSFGLCVIGEVPGATYDDCDQL
jgi:hypothetical protein